MSNDLREDLIAAIGRAVVVDPSVNGYARAALNVFEPVRARLAELENALTWHTTCLACSRVLDSSYAETMRREQAEDVIARIKELVDDLEPDESVSAGSVQAALHQPAQQGE